MTMADQAFGAATTLRREIPAPSSAPVAVAVKDVTKRYGTVAAVDDVSFRVKRGSFTTLLGPSGSGKTTILRMIAGFVFPSSGDIMINDRPVSHIPSYKRSIGVVFQSLALFPHLTVAQNVAYPLKCRRFDRRIIPDLVSEYLKLVQLSGYENRRIDALSGGQRQRVAIARALVYKPDILLLDEPLAALDKKLREEIQMEFRRIQSELRVTTINVTHDQREALVMSDEIIVLDGGRVQQKGAPPEIYRHPSNRFVAGFIGHTNVLAGAVSTCRDGACITIACSGMEVTGYATALDRIPAVGMRAECALRAERLHLGRTRGDLGAFDTCVPGIVANVAYEGDRVLYEISAGEGTTRDFKVLRHEHLPGIDPGDGVFLGWNAEDVVVLSCEAAH